MTWTVETFTPTDRDVERSEAWKELVCAQEHDHLLDMLLTEEWGGQPISDSDLRIVRAEIVARMEVGDQ